MRLYITAAGAYAGTQVEAKADGKGWRPEEVPVSKKELIDYLNKLALADPLKGEGEMPFANTERPPADKETSVFPPSYTHQSVAIDEAWEALPLARKLHYAAMAMEAAREAL